MCAEVQLLTAHLLNYYYSVMRLAIAQWFLKNFQIGQIEKKNLRQIAHSLILENTARLMHVFAVC